MKSINFLLIGILLLNFTGITVYGQAKGCEVLLSSIAGKYTGGCKLGKAEGNGKAEGTDQYMGQFKAGLPDGKGTYTWRNGSVFKGVFVMGLREGQGSLAIKRIGKADSVVNGVWKNDIYAGEYKPEKPYTIHQKSNDLARIDLKKKANSKENSIQFNVSNVGAGNPAFILGTFTVPIPVIADLILTKGSYALIHDNLSTSRGSTKQLSQVNFPFRATLRITNKEVESRSTIRPLLSAQTLSNTVQELDLEITEPGVWTVTIALNQ